MRLALAASLILVVAATADAETSVDARGDADALDIVAVTWALGDATANVEVRFAGADAPDGAAIRAVLILGEPGAAEPAEWYQFTVANATHVFAAHGTPREVNVVSSSWANDTVRLTFERSDPASTSCSFAVVESGVLGTGGFGLLDVAPRGFTSMEAAWPVESCPDPSDEGMDSTTGDTKGSPSPGVVALVAGLIVALALRRR